MSKQVKTQFILFVAYINFFQGNGGHVQVGAAKEPAASHSRQLTIAPRDHGKALINPGMGYVGYYYSHYLDMYGARLAPADALESFPGESTVYLRVTWAQLEPEEGKFNWTLLDTPAQRWIDVGKYCSFRVSCHESGLRYATRNGCRMRAPGATTLIFLRSPGDQGSRSKKATPGNPCTMTPCSWRNWRISSGPWPNAMTTIRTWPLWISDPLVPGARGTPCTGAG